MFAMVPTQHSWGNGGGGLFLCEITLVNFPLQNIARAMIQMKIYLRNFFTREELSAQIVFLISSNVLLILHKEDGMQMKN